MSSSARDVENARFSAATELAPLENFSRVEYHRKVILWLISVRQELEHRQRSKSESAKKRYLDAVEKR